MYEKENMSIEAFTYYFAKATLILYRVPREDDCNQRERLPLYSNTTSSYAITHVTHIFFTSIVKTNVSHSKSHSIYEIVRDTIFQKKMTKKYVQ